MSRHSPQPSVLNPGPRVPRAPPPRSFNKNGMETSLFSVELVDDQGSTIEATFWRAAADKYFDLLAEGSVYTFARGSVKPANKRFSSVRNDYTLNFDAVAEVEPCGASLAFFVVWSSSVAA